MKVTHFKSAAEFRQWLGTNHDRISELWVGFYKKHSGRGGVTYSEALDAALCFGWIDGIKKRVDDLAYTHRFTPRKPRSNWSLVNIRHVERLKKLGLMAPAGLKAFEARDPKKSGFGSAENRPRRFDAALEQKFKQNKKAWTFFRAQPPGYQRLGIWFVMSAKKEETRLTRLMRLMADSAQGRRLR
ncbi:MAG: YdeI/OmpD-associated family protein [Verrucomicrobia bacterium]|nr:YdeI/OmpD-associated family protein [Verrucomicrobiota bacterium]